MFDFRRKTLFCLEKRLSKHKMTIFSKHLWGAWPILPHPGYAYGNDKCFAQSWTYYIDETCNELRFVLITTRSAFPKASGPVVSDLQVDISMQKH